MNLGGIRFVSGSETPPYESVLIADYSEESTVSRELILRMGTDWYGVARKSIPSIAGAAPPNLQKKTPDSVAGGRLFARN